jgi:hypothetical protein
MGSWIDVAELAILVVGGTWAFYNYLRFRSAQAKVGLETRVRFRQEGAGTVLLLGIRVTNTSRVLFRYDEAAVTLIDASARTEDGRVLLVPFARDEFLVPVYGVMSEDPSEIQAGRLFSLAEEEPISLEPGEHVDSDAAFVLRDEVALMAVRISVRGWQGRWGRRSYWWGSFQFIDPDEIQPSSVEGGRRGGTIKPARRGDE